MFVSSAFAQDAAATAQQGGGDFFFGFMMPLILIFMVFYFFVIKPQNKRYREHKRMVDGLRRGDRVVTGGGLIGTVKKTGEEEVTLELAEGVQVRAMKNTIMLLRAKTEPGDTSTVDEKPAKSKKQKKTG